jgi:hypothetical protein
MFSRKIVGLFLVAAFAMFAYDYLGVGDASQDSRERSGQRIVIPEKSEPAPSKESAPEPTPSPNPTPDQSDFRLVRSIAENAADVVVDTRKRIQDMGRLVEQIEDDVRSLDRVDPIVREDIAEEIRDVRGQAIENVNEQITVLPARITRMKEGLSGITLAGSGEMIDVQAQADADIVWLETDGMRTLHEIRGRLRSIRIPD